jgi:hypothetical protein
MRDLWGDNHEILLPPKSTPSSITSKRIVYTSNDCHYFGHAWEVIGMSGEKQCTVCHIKGNCPGCTSIPPKGARPFSCTKHTPQQHQEVQA